jgi:hypothetical protein
MAELAHGVELVPAAARVGDDVREDGQGLGEVHVLHGDGLGDVQGAIREVPNAADACIDKVFGAFLGGRAGDGQDAEFDVELFDDAVDFIHRANLDAVDGAADEEFVCIKGGGDGEILFFKARVAEEGAAEGTGANERGIGRAVPTKCAVDGLAQFFRGVAAAWAARDASHREVLTRKNGIEPEFFRENGRRDAHFAACKLGFDSTKIHRIPTNCRQRKGGHFARRNLLRVHGRILYHIFGQNGSSNLAEIMV